MNRTKLKNYAPQARRDFIQAMTDRAAYYGLTATKTEPVVEKGDVAVIGGRSFPVAVAKKRKALEDRIKKHGFQQTMEAMAYTWFNRLVAIRFMELHGYLDHGYRVLSPAGSRRRAVGSEEITAYCLLPTAYSLPEILLHAEHVELPGLKKDTVIDLKLAGNKEGELYRLLLTAQCNALHTAMPFLFEKIDDETELLLPDNLLNSDSLMRKLVGEIEEEDWQEVEIIGWLYQFYISEKKDEVIGKVVASEDIPAATQLFTPNWIVKYLVQNTLGRQWLATYPQSALRQQMEYYIEPAEQTLEVQEQLKAITPTSLNPEELTLLDPACGSGHILVEAYDLFKAIYQERGYRAKDIPALILTKNLFGLEIDDRAAQLAAFALMMKARADDRRIFDKASGGRESPDSVQPNILSFQDSQGMNATDITHALNSPILQEPSLPKEMLFEEIEEEKAGLFSKKSMGVIRHVVQADVVALLELFENAKTFGSLIRVPPKLAAKLPEIEKRLDDVLKFGDLTHASAHVLKPLLQQARLLGRNYDAVVANPPYMGGKYFAGTLKVFVADQYKEAKADLYACFISRNLAFAKPNALVGMITIPNWMFLTSFSELRKSLLAQQAIDTFIHNGRGVFGSDFGSCSFTIHNSCLQGYRGTYRRLFDKQGSVASNEDLRQRFFTAVNHTPRNSDFPTLPGSPIAYWINQNMLECFRRGKRLGDLAEPRVGLQTNDVNRFLRKWHEVDGKKIAFQCESREQAKLSGGKWFPHHKGGDYRRWYGNNEWVVNWEDDGKEMYSLAAAINGSPSRTIRSPDFYFRPCLTWSDVSISSFAVRWSEAGHIFDISAPCIFPASNLRLSIAGFLCSAVAVEMLRLLNSTVHFLVSDIASLPVLVDQLSQSTECIQKNALSAIEIARQDWNSSETSWDFSCSPVIQNRAATLRESQDVSDSVFLERFRNMKKCEELNNRLFIDAYGLQDELSPEVPDDQITLYRPDREEDIKRLASYAIGCMMGRYSLDQPGLIYARSCNQGFDQAPYTSFRADDDGIIPLLETDWGIRDDATNRIVEFINVCWPGNLTTDHTDITDNKDKGKDELSSSVSSVKSVVKTSSYLDENIRFIEDSLGTTIRQYLANGFYKHHLSMYKKRPIYWLFSSGKQRAFQCLVYLHRYHEGTLARMRTEYVIPLQGQIAGRIEQLEGDKAKATSTSHRKKLQKEQDDLKKQQTELLTFEEKLKHAADQKIALDLDDGVKVNYGKFGDLLAESKAICGTKEED